MKKVLIAICLIWSASAQAYQPAVVSANPEATRVGIEVLKKGGTAADAAIATAFALSVVEPYNSGLGGGGFILYYNAKEKEFSFLDYRESAPASIASVKSDFKKPATAIGVPGFVKGMEVFYKRFSKISWKDLIQPSIELAQKGLPIKGMLEKKIEDKKDLLNSDPYLKELYADAAGKDSKRVDLVDLSRTLEAIQKGGSIPFYQGGLAKAMVATIRKQGGILTGGDLASYRTFWRRPVQFRHNNYKIISAPPPSSGGMALDMMYRKSIVYRIKNAFPYSPEASRSMMNVFKEYFEFREIALGDTGSNLVAHTTHVSIIDSEGNMVAMTNTLNHPFGAGIGVPGTGIILNDEMRDFSQKVGSPNRASAGRRPLSSMSPTFVYKDDAPYLIIGTPGGLTIPQNIFQILYSITEWGASVDGAISRPKIYYSPDEEHAVVEKGVSGRIEKALSLDRKVDEMESIGNVQALVIKSATNTAPLSDRRGEGAGETFNP